MTPSTPPTLSPQARANLRLYIAVAASLALHAVLILMLQFGAVEHGRPPARVIEARLASSSTEVQPVLLKAIDRTVHSEVKDWTPPPAPPAPQPPAATPASKPATEEYRPGMSREAAGATNIDAPLPADTTYYSAREVDEHPVLVSGGKPIYPAAASQSNIRGEVLVLFTLNENGMVEDVSVIEAKPPNQGFEEAVTAWLKNARFRPALRKGRTVKSRSVYRVHFDP